MSVGQIDTRVCQQNAEYNLRESVLRKLSCIKTCRNRRPRKYPDR